MADKNLNILLIKQMIAGVKRDAARAKSDLVEVTDELQELESTLNEIEIQMANEETLDDLNSKTWKVCQMFAPNLYYICVYDGSCYTKVVDKDRIEKIPDYCKIYFYTNKEDAEDACKTHCFSGKSEYILNSGTIIKSSVDLIFYAHAPYAKQIAGGNKIEVLREA